MVLLILDYAFSHSETYSKTEIIEMVHLSLKLQEAQSTERAEEENPAPMWSTVQVPQVASGNLQAQVSGEIRGLPKLISTCWFLQYLTPPVATIDCNVGCFWVGDGETR